MTPEEAAHLQYLYAMARREYVADPANGLIPYPNHDNSKRLPEPAVLDGEDPELG